MVVDPRVLGPGLAPTPFTAEEIRDGCPAGRTVRLLVEEDGAEPYERVNRFVVCDETGATIERHTPIGTVTARSTWGELQAHAAFPLADTTIDRETLDLPVGRLDCLRYTVRDRETGGVNVFWFAPEHPGMPVRFTRLRDGRVVATTTMVATGSAAG